MLTNTIQAQQFPAVIVKDDQTDAYAPLKMSALKIDVKVVANLATTTMAMTFYNDLNRVLEGQLTFPLGAGQTVSGFAMDVNGALREGVVVEKEKGRQVFEDVVRSQIDPGLLEWTKGNTFKSRVYPIPAKGYKQIVMTYEQELPDMGSGFGYALPLKFKDKVDVFVVKVEVFKQNIAPNLDKNELENFQFKQWRESYLAQAEFKDYLPNKQLTFTLPKEANRQRIFVETDPSTALPSAALHSTAPTVRGSYFYLNLDPKLLQAGKKLPQKICLLWDVSGSVASRDIEKELAVLDGYFQKIGNLTVDVVRFSNAVEAPQPFTVKDGKWTELAQHLKSLPYDGGTQLGALDLNALTCDEFILSSDGISNFGAADITLAKTPLIVLNSSLTAEHSYLQYLARATGGVYLNLTTLKPAQALSLLSTQPYTFISATYAKDLITETYPGLPTVVTSGFALAGILLKDQAEITLNFGFGNDVKYSQTIVLDKAQHASASGLAKRIWAQKKIAELDVMYARNAEAITELGKQFAIVTRNTSLIVLDRLEDYVKYRIVPPKEMQEEYFNIIEAGEAAQKKSEGEHLDEVATKFQAQIEWWHMEFPFGKPPKLKAQNKNLDRDELRAMRSEAPAPSMAMAPEMTLGGAARDGFASGQGTTASAADAKGMNPGESSAATADITLAKWDPQTPYLQALRQNPGSAWYATYLDQKKTYANSSAFYLDVADFFAEAGQRDVALRILSNIAEMELENHQLLRILGYRLMQTGHYALAIAVFEDVLKIRAEEPQSYRDLGLAYAADKQYQQAVDRLYVVVRKAWDGRFPDIELIALHELNAIVATCAKKLDVGTFDGRLVQNLPVDIRVILTWDADNCDIDLWVVDPNGEQCDYSHKATYIGGRMSRDFTRGYGPEEFLLKRALPGKYQIKANYYGNQQQILAGATTIQAALFTNFGKPNQQQKALTLRLKDTKEVVNVGEFEFK
jgi:tetratricopeptide (TPR) repeat protein